MSSTTSTSSSSPSSLSFSSHHNRIRHIVNHILPQKQGEPFHSQSYFGHSDNSHPIHDASSLAAFPSSFSPSPPSPSPSCPSTVSLPYARNPHCLSPTSIAHNLRSPSTYHMCLLDIHAAARRLHGVAHVTPVIENSTLNAMCGVKLYFKCENLQKIGAFKFRGALNAAKEIKEQIDNNHKKSSTSASSHSSHDTPLCSPPTHTLITHSSGNHAQALALASSLCGFQSVIVMPNNAPKTKKDAVIGYGANVVSCDSTQKAREDECEKQMKIHSPHCSLVPPYDDLRVMSGQGTIAMEFLSQIPMLDAIVVPVGGGGMLSGICIAAKSLNPKILIFAAEPALASDAYESLQKGKLTPLPSPTSTIADGLRTSLGQHNFPIIRDCVNECILVSEDEIVSAMKFFWERTKFIIEASAAVGVAVVMGKRMKQIVIEGFPVQGEKEKRKIQHVGVVLCGGNVDLDQLPWVKK